MSSIAIRLLRGVVVASLALYPNAGSAGGSGSIARTTIFDSGVTRGPVTSAKSEVIYYLDQGSLRPTVSHLQVEATLIDPATPWGAAPTPGIPIPDEDSLNDVPDAVNARRVVLTHHLPAAVLKGQAKPLGHLPILQRMELSIVLPLRNQSELTSLLKRIYDPSSSDYHHFLNVQEFADRFAPTREDYAKVIEFAAANGFEVHGSSTNRLTVSISGSVGRVERAFQVEIQEYQHPTQNRDFYSPDREPSVPAGLPISHIAGMSNYALPKSMALRLPVGAKGADVQGSGPGGNYLACDMRAAYYGGTALTGHGQTIGLMQFDGYDIEDVIQSFVGQATLGLSGSEFVVNYTPPNSHITYSVPLHNVLLDGATGAPGQFISPADDAEQVLDIVQSIGMAPGLSQVRVYIGSNDADILSAIASENVANEVSISWAWTPEDLASVDQFFEEMAAQGQSVFVASGDSGAYSPDSPHYFPAEDQWVTAVGATDLTTDGAGGSYSSERAWDQSGGGVSPDGIRIPSWQLGVADSGNLGSTVLRNIPDVAMEGNFDNFNCDMGECSNDWAGTSFASARWAGFVALVNQQASAANNSPVGFLNPSIYTIGQESSFGSKFHDVVLGETNYEPGYGFYAVPGYDLATGWGSPAGQDLINALAPISFPAPTATALTISPNSSSLTVGSNFKLTASVTSSPGAAVPSGSVVFKIGSATQAVPLNASGVANYTATAPASSGTLSMSAIYQDSNEFASSASNTLTESIVDNPVSGTVVLAGANNYPGPIIMRAGTLEVDGSLPATTTVYIGCGASLTGTGRIDGNVVFLCSGSTPGPGLTINGTVGTVSTNRLAATAGTPQSANINAPFATPLTVTVTDNGAGVSGLTMTFVALGSGASATLSNGGICTTDATGSCSVTATANALVGTYEVTAQVSGISELGTVTYALTNAIPILVVTSKGDDAGTAGNCTTQTSTTTGSDASCSLRDALLEAGNLTGADIYFDTATVFLATNTDLQNTIRIAEGLTVGPRTSIYGATTGSGRTLHNLVTVDGSGSEGSIFLVPTANAALIANLNILNGHGQGVGAIVNNGILTIASSTFLSNSAGSEGSGGAILSKGGTLNVTNSTFSGNSAEYGGAICSSGSTVSVTNSTFFGNSTSSGGDGGAILSNGGILSVINSTFSGNSAAGGRGDGAIGGIGSSMTVTNSILTRDAGGECVGSGCPANGVDGNIVGTAETQAILGPLANYGGPTQTMPPLPGSPAICAGSANSATAMNLTTDQRGEILDLTTVNAGAYTGAGGYCPAGSVDAGAVQTSYALSFSAKPSPIPPAAAISVNADFLAGVTLEENGAPFTASSISILLRLTGNGSLSGGTASTSSGIANFTTLQVSAAGTGDLLNACLTLNPGTAPATILCSTSSTFNVVTAVPTLSFTPATASQGYGTAITQASLNASASYSGANVSGTFAYTTNVKSKMMTLVAGETVLPAGNYTITATFTPTDATAYAGTSMSASYVVNQAWLSILASSDSMTYGGAVPAIAASYSGFVNSDSAASLTTQPVCSTAATSTSMPGTYPSICTGAVDDNYSIDYVPGSVTVKKATPTIALSSSSNPSGIAQFVTLMATISSPLGSPTGTVAFYDGTAFLGSGTLSSGIGTYSTSALALGTHSVTAQYSGDANFTEISSSALDQIVVYSLTISPAPGAPSTANGDPGSVVMFLLSVTSPPNSPVNFTITGLPPGFTANFSPNAVPAGSCPTEVKLSINIPAQSARGSLPTRPGSSSRLAIALGVLLVPLLGRSRSARRAPRLLPLAVLALAELVALVGCSSFHFGNSAGMPTGPIAYSLTVTATAGNQAQSTDLILNVQ